MRRGLSARHPYFEHATAKIFTAYAAGKCAGRVAAHINQEHLKRHKDGVGFFDTIDDPDVAAALLDEVVSWHRQNGTKTLRGPISLTMAEEVGCLIEGFETPPMLLMGHHRPYQAALIERCGLQKVRDAYA